MPDEISLMVQTNKTVFPVTDGQQLVYVLMMVMPADVLASVQMPLNYCLVLDHSGSMSGTKIENLKAAARLAIEEMTAQDLVSVVIFDDSVQVLLPAQPVSDSDAIKARIDKIRAEGGTKIARGMRAGLDELIKGVRADRVSRMLLLTDGETYGDEQECRLLAAEAAQRNIAISALGLGEGWNETLLDALAQASGGVSDFISEGQPEAILGTFQRQVRSAQRSVVQNAQLLLRLAEGVTARAVWRVTPMISLLGQRTVSVRDVQVILGDMERGKGQSVLVELLVPPLLAGKYRLAQAEIAYDVASLGLRGEKVKTDVVLAFSVDSMETAASHAAVLNVVEKVTAHKLQTRALDEAAVGNIAGATQKLRAAATRLLGLGEPELAAVARQEADRLEQGQGLSAHGTKKLRYETRKLTQKLDD
ncbi:MAG: VWA domain-containing protein [Anaerolineae bacterium]|jgi:Ca-activated chloride channel family protein|nr:VWA domain-containing protein [Anaerolineae bacterium]